MENHSNAQLVQLNPDHPGFRDPAYRARRDAIARAAFAHTRGSPPPHIDYTDEEHDVWKLVRERLEPLHQRYAPRLFLEELSRLDGFRERIPQMAEVNAAVRSGFTLAPVAGLVTPEFFMEALAERTFFATQYLRHPSRPLYTPEPDLVHEYIGHAIALSNERYATLNEAFGHATRKAKPAQYEALIRTYWYTIEFGLVVEDGLAKAFGAGLLSSFGELESFSSQASIVPLDLDVIAATPFDPTQYQSTLFVAPSFDVLERELTNRLEQLAAK